MNHGPDLALRIAGGLVAVALGVLTAVYEAFYTPLYLGSVRLPLSVVFAVITNYALVWFTYEVTGHRLLALVPGLVWMGVMIVASGRTAEGDMLLLPDNWVALITIFAGVGGFTLAGYRLVARPPSPPQAPPSPPQTPAALQ